MSRRVNRSFGKEEITGGFYPAPFIRYHDEEPGQPKSDIRLVECIPTKYDEQKSLEALLRRPR
jgi:hypothetical protein